MSQVTSADGTTIAYDHTGSGPSVILVDGALCSRAFGPLGKLAALLAQHFRVYTYDRRGRGQSGDNAAYSVAREVEDLGALIQAAGGSAYVFGTSSGAALALEAAASGLPIAKLALYEPPFVAEATGGAEPDHLARLQTLVANDRRADAVSYFMRDMVHVPGFARLMMRVMFPVWSKLKAVAHTLPYDAAILGDWSVPVQRAAAVQVPALVLCGGKTEERLRRAAQRVAEAIPGAQQRVLAGQTHTVAAGVLAPVLQSFFA